MGGELVELYTDEAKCLQTVTGLLDLNPAYLWNDLLFFFRYCQKRCLEGILTWNLATN